MELKHIAVTGGSGFIGAATVDYANSQGHVAWAFDRSKGEDILGDLDALAGATHIIHLAGMLGTSELFDTPTQAIEANVVGTLRILQWCREHGAGYTGISMPDSSWANVYQATKLCAMRLASAWNRAYGVPVSHVRAYNAYGPGQKHGPGHPQKILPTFATAAWSQKPIPIWGNGLQTVDLVYSGDVARMLVDATEFGNDEVFDAGTGTSMTVRQVAGVVNRYARRDPDSVVFSPMRAGETPETDIVARGEGWDLLGWHPTLDPERIKETVEWYRP
jgi:nucleoside-diphosphate-sugar epimerase